jgi:hypothetical protein
MYIIRQVLNFIVQIKVCIKTCGVGRKSIGSKNNLFRSYIYCTDKIFLFSQQIKLIGSYKDF